MSNELIVVKQLPIIEDQLREVKAKIEARVALSLSLACTEETYKEVKKERAALSSEFAALEARRKEVKKAILAPYEQFEALYKECAGDIYADADRRLREKISTVENGIKQERRNELIAFFSEYRESKGIDPEIVKFEDTGIVVTMSASKKSLRATVSEYLDRIAGELALIETMEDKDEILVEYRTSRNLSRAVFIVKERHKAIEEASRKRASAQPRKMAQEIAAAQVLQVAEADQHDTVNAVAVPSQTPVCEQSETEKRYSVSFTVEGTLPQLKSLKAFLSEGGYTWDTIK